MKNENYKNYDFFYVARQPILDRRGITYGYELLFRSGVNKTFAEIKNQDFATMSVATCGFTKSQEAIDQLKRIFINFTEHLGPRQRFVRCTATYGFIAIKFK